MSTDMYGNTGMREMFLRTVAVVGLLAVLILGAWGIIVLATSIPALFERTGSGLSSFFNFGPREEIIVSAPATLSSGMSLPVSWNHKDADGEHRYTVSYSCEDGLTMKAPLPNGKMEDVACDRPFNYTGASSNIALVPTITGSTPVPVTVTVASVRLDDNEEGKEGSATIVINPTTAPRPAPTGYEPATTTPKKKPAPSTYVPAAIPAKTLYGYGDLRVSINSTIPEGNRITVMFTVENVGTNVVREGWTFDAEFPWERDTYTYTSPMQQKLNPGDKIVYFLGFDEDDGKSDFERFTVIVDLKNRVQEASEGNNAASIRL